MDRVVADRFVPQLDLLQHLAGPVLRLSGFVDLDAGCWRHDVRAGLLADHPAVYQAAGHKPGIRCATSTRLGARCLHNFRVARRRPKGRERPDNAIAATKIQARSDEILIVKIYDSLEMTIRRSLGTHFPAF